MNLTKFSITLVATLSFATAVFVEQLNATHQAPDLAGLFGRMFGCLVFILSFNVLFSQISGVMGALSARMEGGQSVWDTLANMHQCLYANYDKVSKGEASIWTGAK